MSAKKLAEHFSELEDPRCSGKVEHLFIDILVIAVCAVIAGAESWVDMALYGQNKADRLSTFLRLPNGIPAHDTFRRVFMIQRILRVVSQPGLRPFPLARIGRSSPLMARWCAVPSTVAAIKARCMSSVPGPGREEADLKRAEDNHVCLSLNGAPGPYCLTL
jgi:DDE_Tnp_1-associated